MSHHNSDDLQIDKNAPFRSSRRAAKQGRATKNMPRRRHILVHADRRDEPDVRKFLRALGKLAIADAERERQAQLQDKRAEQRQEPANE